MYRFINLMLLAFMFGCNNNQPRDSQPAANVDTHEDQLAIQQPVYDIVALNKFKDQTPKEIVAILGKPVNEYTSGIYGHRYLIFKVEYQTEFAVYHLKRVRFAFREEGSDQSPRWFCNDYDVLE